MSRAAAGRLAAALVAVAALAGAGCAGSTAALSPRTARQQADEIEQLQERVLDLQRRLAVAEVELDRLRREVARLEGGGAPTRRGGTVGSDRPGGTLPGRDLDEASPPRRQSTFEIEDLEDEVPPPPDRPPSAVEETEGGEPDEGTAVRPGPRPPERETARTPAPDAAAPSAGSTTITDEAQELYDRGYTLYHQGRHLDAESTFQRFLQRHPGTELADNAQYWIGEARFARGDLEGALAAFRETATRFPEGNKVPDALLKAGEVEAARGNSERAREIYRGVIERFPGTTAAAVAEDRLAELG